MIEIVASELQAFRDVLGDAGMYARVGDAASFATIIGALLDDTQRLERMATAAKRRSERFSIGHAADSYEALYAEAVAEPAD